MRVSHHFALLGLLTAPLWAGGAQAAVPTEYTGTPYLGTPKTIPGRIDFADVDLGGIDVAWNTDHNRMTDAAQSGDDYRAEDMALPNINKTNRFLIDQTWSEDFWEEAAGGGRYPSEAEPHAYYLGASHVDDWVRITVNVEQAGTYNVSSNWACDNNPCGLSIWFNDDSGVADNPDRPLDGANKTGTVSLETTGDYHLWREYPNFTTVELSAGEQVMTFYVEIADHLQYSFLQFDLVGGGEGGAGGAGGAGGQAASDAGAGAGGAPTGGSPAMAAGAGGMMMASAGTVGNSAGMPAQGGSSVSAGGSPGAAPGAAGMTATTGGSAPAAPMSPAPTAAAAPETDTGATCAYAPHSTIPGFAYAIALVIGGALLRRRK